MDICYYCNQKSKAAGKLDQKELEKMGHSCNQVVFQKGEIAIKVNNSFNVNIYFRKITINQHMIKSLAILLLIQLNGFLHYKK